MALSVSRRFFFFLLLVTMCPWLQAQNLVPNYSFETISECPSTYGQVGLSLAPPWFAPTEGTPDLFNTCATNPQFDVPENYTGFQPPLTGDGYFGMISYGYGTNFREYISAPLLQPLNANTWYHVSFYVSLANLSCGINRFGAYFSTLPPSSNNFFQLNVDPQIEANQGYLNDTLGWELISGCFQAEGGEAYITLGNFYSDAQSTPDPDCNFTITYFLLENITVEEGDAPEEIPLDLGGPEIACSFYLIDPEISGYTLLWEDGSTGPTLEVTETGTYSLTITDGCNFGIDSIDITILSSLAPLDIGPPEITLCDGESYTITLDPALSEYEWQDGSSDPTYIITSPGLYAVTLDDGCSMVSDEILVTELLSPAPISLGEDQYICEGDEIVFSFDPSQGNFIWQDNSTGSTFTATTGGTYAVTISNMCGMVSDEIILSALAPPEVTLGPNVQMMCEGDVIDLELDPDLGDILWPDASTLPFFAITMPGSYTVFVTNECGTGSDVVDVTILAVPVFNLGPDTTLCAGDTLLLSAPGFIGEYEWQDQSENDTLLVTSPGLYTLNVSNFCGDGFDQLNISYAPNVEPFDFGPDISLCPGEQTILYANNPNGNYVWQDMSSADSFLITTSGTYTLQVSNACSLEADTITVIINDSPPLLNLPDEISLCLGESVTLDALIGSVTYLWNDNSNGQQLLVNSPGTYSLTVSNACGMDADTTIVLDGGPAPMVILGNDIDLCPGEIVTLAPQYTNVTSWLWHDGSSSSEFIVSLDGEVSVQVYNACGSAADTLQVALLPATPDLDLGADTSLCFGESFVLSIHTPGINILWPDGSSAPDFNVTGAGSIYASISNSCGVSFDSLQVGALPEIPTLQLGPDQSLCPGEFILVSPGIANVAYLWQDGSTGNIFQTNQEGIIILTITNPCGASTDTLAISESTEGPQVNLGADVQACEGEIVTILSGVSGVDYLWQDGSTNANYITSQSGELIIHVSNNCGIDSDTLLVDISGVPPTPVLGPDTSLCEGIPLILVSLADSETDIAWQDGSSTPIFTVVSPGTYILSEANRCGEAADTIDVSYLDAPDPFSLGPDTTLCPGDAFTLRAPSAAFEIRWHDGSHQPEIIANVGGIYALTLSNACGVITDTIQVDFDTLVPQINLDPSLSWCEGDIITLDATQQFNASYLWSTGDTSPSIQVTAPGQYSIDVTTLCTDASQTIAVIPDSDCILMEFHEDIYIPNVFSPNGDGINDVFAASLGSDLEVIAMEGIIYDRWGNQVYSSAALPFAWDGLFNGEQMSPGVYVYVIRIELPAATITGIEKIFTGDVTLIR